MHTNQNSLNLYRAVPGALRERKQWVCHDEAKRPFRAYDGKFASTTDPSSWGTFEQAEARARDSGGSLGIGFVFTHDDPFVGIDFDGVAEPHASELAPHALDAVSTLRSYTELSPSRSGIHIIVQASGLDFAGGTFKDAGGNKVEVYRRARYFTVTGTCLVGSVDFATVKERTDELRTFLLSLKRVTAVSGLDGTRGGRPVNFEVVRYLFSHLGVPVRVDGRNRLYWCPFHNDRKEDGSGERSLAIGARGYKCFGQSEPCPATRGGGAIRLRRLIAELTDQDLLSVSSRTGSSLEGLSLLREELRASLGLPSA